MDFILEQLRDFPSIALFSALCLGYLVGSVKMGRFALGGVAGSLLVAVMIGQVSGIHVDDALKDMFFALFIFMCGYNGGPQFFKAVRLRSEGWSVIATSQTLGKVRALLLGISMII